MDATSTWNEYIQLHELVRPGPHAMDILHKFFRNTATPVELGLMDDWIAADEQQDDYFNKLVNIRITLGTPGLLYVLDQQRLNPAYPGADDPLPTRFLETSAIFNFVNDLLIHHGPQGEMLHVSASCDNLLGYQPNEWEGKSLKQYVHPDDQGGWQKWMNALLSIDRNTYTERFRYRLVHINGDSIWVESSGSRLSYPGDDLDVTGVITLTRSLKNVPHLHGIVEKMQDELSLFQVDELSEDNQRGLRSLSMSVEILDNISREDNHPEKDWQELINVSVRINQLITSYNENRPEPVITLNRRSDIMRKMDPVPLNKLIWDICDTCGNLVELSPKPTIQLATLGDAIRFEVVFREDSPVAAAIRKELEFFLRKHGVQQYESRYPVETTMLPQPGGEVTFHYDFNVFHEK